MRPYYISRILVMYFVIKLRIFVCSGLVFLECVQSVWHNQFPPTGLNEYYKLPLLIAQYSWGAANNEVLLYPSGNNSLNSSSVIKPLLLVSRPKELELVDGRANIARRSFCPWIDKVLWSFCILFRSYFCNVRYFLSNFWIFDNSSTLRNYQISILVYR